MKVTMLCSDCREYKKTNPEGWSACALFYITIAPVILIYLGIIFVIGGFK